jgi:DNA mismatch repair protein MutS
MCGVPVHAAESYLLTLIQEGLSRRRLRADSRTRRRPRSAAAQGGGEARRRARRHPRHADRGHAARRARRTTIWRPGRDRRGAGALAWCDMSTGEFHVSALPRRRWGGLGASRARRSAVGPGGGGAEAGLRARSRTGAAADAAAGSRFDSVNAAAASVRAFEVARWTLSESFARPNWRRWARWSTIWTLTQRSAAAAPAAAAPPERGALMASTRRRAAISNSPARSRASARAACWPPSTAP